MTDIKITNFRFNEFIDMDQQSRSNVKYIQQESFNQLMSIIQRDGETGNFDTIKIKQMEYKSIRVKQNIQHKTFDQLMSLIEREIKASDLGKADPLNWIINNKYTVERKNTPYRNDRYPVSYNDYNHIAFFLAARDTFIAFTDFNYSQYTKGDIRSYFWAKYRHYYDPVNNSGLVWHARKNPNEMSRLLMNDVYSMYQSYVAQQSYIQSN